MGHGRGRRRGIQGNGFQKSPGKAFQAVINVPVQGCLGKIAGQGNLDHPAIIFYGNVEIKGTRVKQADHHRLETKLLVDLGRHLAAVGLRIHRAQIHPAAGRLFQFVGNGCQVLLQAGQWLGQLVFR